MNTAKIKTYAIQARRDFIKAVTERANIYGIFSDDHIEPIEFKGDMAIIGERAFPKKEGELREKLVRRIKRDGFSMSMRACAYTWFNRFVALRYMEIHDYLEHGYRALSNNGGAVIPEILEHAADVDFQGLDKDKVIELKLAGTKDNELYRLLLLAQCDHLHRSMPFLFDRIDNETELLLPDNLLHSDSPLRKLVTEIDESDWNDVEIIGWIYQFYISDKKDEVIGKVVKSEDIPAATQLFTPNWIVKYMVQNTLGRMWMATYPDSTLKDRMEYYIEPASQELEVQEQLDSITPKELNPEEITFLDPACGSGHILVEAYDVLKDIYLERGYRTRDIPRLILEKNIFGLDICDRAAQLAYFAVLMKAREDDRRILGRDDLMLNVMAIQEAKPSDTRNIELFFKGDEYKDIRGDLYEFVSLFEKGKTFGSLITVPDHLVQKVESVEKTVADKIGKWFSQSDVRNIVALVKQARVLAKKYDCIVTNPPYMGNRYLNIKVKKYLRTWYDGYERDLFSSVIKRCTKFGRANAFLGFMTPLVWMFISTYEKLRIELTQRRTLTTLVQLEYSGFAGATVPVCAFTFANNLIKKLSGSFIRLSNFRGAENQSPKTLEAINNRLNCNWYYESKQDEFKKIPGSPIAYWVKNNLRDLFEKSLAIDQLLELVPGMDTGNNNKFLRLWSEISKESIAFSYYDIKTIDLFKKYWIPCNKGGKYRKWYGNNEYVINWKNEGKDLHRARTKYKRYYLKPGITWTYLSSSFFAARSFEEGFLWDRSGSCAFEKEKINKTLILGLLCSTVGKYLLDIINPTLNYQLENIKIVPFSKSINNYSDKIKSSIKQLIEYSKEDWNSFETSWNFSINPMLNIENKDQLAEDSFINWKKKCENRIGRSHKLELEINQLFIGAYELRDELNPQIPEDQITLARADQETDIKRLISYAIGCMVGRYSLDHPGLIYAHSSNIDFDPSKYKTFPADEDGIIPIMDQDWFPDDTTNRFIDFLKVAWSPETLDENLKFIGDSLKPKRNETPIDTIRRYLSTSFFKDHIKTYKKRPIYWLFSSGKQKAFECLVYLHRYNESTLSRMRSTYVTPLQSNISSRLEFLQTEKDTATTTSAKNKFQKEIDKLKKKQAELSKFDDELRHYADMKISLDLDDGVKVNYGKFGNLLAEKKAITGKK